MSRSKAQFPEIAITGLGIVSCHGADPATHRSAFQQQTCVLREVDRTDGYHRAGGSTTAALVDPACFRSILPPIKARRMSPPSRFGMVAAKLAVQDARLDPEVLAAEHGSDVTGVVFGTSFGPSSYSERILRQIILESPQAASPMLFTESVANAPAAQVALALRCRGPNITITQREASALLAVAEGAALIRSGKVRRALVGGVEELNPLLHAILDRFGALTRPGAANDQAEGAPARPLDRRRQGFVAAEGSAVLVLERLDDAQRRGARVRSRVGFAARGFDPHAPVTGWSRSAPATARRLEREWLRLNGVAAEPDATHAQAPVLVLGANGGQSHDRFEASLLSKWTQTWKRQGMEPEVFVPKRCFGEQGMATMAGALLLMEGLQPEAPASFEVDPQVALQPSRIDRPTTIDPGRTMLLSAVAAGGACCWLGLESV